MLPLSRATSPGAPYDPLAGELPHGPAAGPAGSAGDRGEPTSRGGQPGPGPGEPDELALEPGREPVEVDAAAADRQVAEADRLRRDRHRQEAQRLESLGALAGGLAHQFNNLLTVIAGHAGLAAADAIPGSNQAHSLAEVRAAAQRAAVLCRQMLDAAGHSVAARRPLHLATLCEDALARARASAGARCRIEYLPALLPLPQVRGVPAQLHQALSTVFLNAFEAVGEGAGLVRIALHDQLLDAVQAAALATPLRPGRHVCVEVCDDGVGIAADKLGRIFEPFFSTKGLGRGLGLAAAAGILRAHGGAIGVESREGAGSTFRLYLPALEASAAGN